MYHDILLTQYTKVHSFQATDNHFIQFIIYLALQPWGENVGVKVRKLRY